MVRFVFILLAFATSLYTKLIKRPADVYVFPGENARLICSTEGASTPADWRFRRYGSQQTETVYESGFFKSLFLERHEVVSDEDGTNNLIISNVGSEDAGTYFCIDLAGMGERAQAELIVIEESGPTCKSNITSSEGVLGDNDCHLDPDIIGYNCTVKYLGNVAPVLQWWKSGMAIQDNETNSLSKNQNNELFSINKLVVPSMMNLHGTFFVCRIRDMESAIGRKTSCSTQVVNVLYARNISEQLVVKESEPSSKSHNCTIHTNINNCRTYWTAPSQKKEIHNLGQSVIHLNQPDTEEITMNYECFGECRVSGKMCHVKGKTIKFIPDTTVVEDLHWSTQEKYKVTLMTCLIVAGFVICSLVVCILKKFCKRRRCAKQDIWRSCCEQYEERESVIRIEKIKDGFRGFRNKFKRDAEFLNGIDVLDAENGFIECLFAKKLLTLEEVNELCTSGLCNTNQGLVLKLCELLQPKLESDDEIKLFMKALKETNQKHVLNYLTNKSDENCRPLREDELRLIDNNFNSLIRLLDTNKDFLEMLAKNGCITRTHLNAIRDLPTKSERNGKLIEILSRRSYGDVIQFKKCLKRANHAAINELLDIETDYTNLHDEHISCGCLHCCLDLKHELICCRKHDSQTSDEQPLTANAGVDDNAITRTDPMDIQKTKSDCEDCSSANNGTDDNVNEHGMLNKNLECVRKNNVKSSVLFFHRSKSHSVKTSSNDSSESYSTKDEQHDLTTRPDEHKYSEVATLMDKQAGGGEVLDVVPSNQTRPKLSKQKSDTNIHVPKHYVIIGFQRPTSGPESIAQNPCSIDSNAKNKLSLNTHKFVPESETAELVPESGTSEIVSETGTSKLVPKSGTLQFVPESRTPQLVSESGTSEIVPEYGTSQPGTESGALKSSQDSEASKSVPGSNVFKSSSEFKASNSVIGTILSKSMPVNGETKIEDIWELILTQSSDHKNLCTIAECSTKTDFEQTIKRTFENIGKQVETVAFVLTGRCSPKGLIFPDGSAHKLDDILKQISSQHMTSFKEGILPNHVTVIFLCSYGHCFSVKKYANSMSVIKCTNDLSPVIKLCQCQFLLSTIFPGTHKTPNIHKRVMPI